MPEPEDRWRRVDALFGEALDRAPCERAAFLDQACGGDAALRHEVGALLDAHEAAAHFLDEPADWLAAPAALAGTGDGAALLAGRPIGPYRLVEKLGEGGMGTVWLAERADGHFEHRVALKLVRAGLTSDDLRRRFRQERQILARLSHPHIARLLDGGVVAGPDGQEQPYLVMELVDGEPITAFADRRGLSTEARLALFAQVADAVAYAHRSLVVHRDLKPSNVLVDAGGQVKLLDFGIARLLGEGDGDGSQTLLPALTPEYAAPEQVRSEPVTTATDVYALGVVLYELLTGQRPYTFARHTPAEVERVVCEQEPERPSAVSGGDRAAGSARAEGADALKRRLRGDLDAIVLKALAKEPAARYPTADAFLDDVRRHLAGQPVVACAPTAGYRTRLFVRRHRWGVAAAAAFVLLLTGATVVTAVQAGVVAAERDRAQSEADKATRVTDFLLSLFEANDPNVARGDTLTAGELMARGLREAEALEHQPDVQARMLEVIGSTYERMGRVDLAAAPLERALALRRRLHPAPHPDLARSLFLVSQSAFDRGDAGRAEALYREALAMQLHLFGADHPEVGATLYSLAGVLHHLPGRSDEADSLYQEARWIFQHIPLTPDPELMGYLVDMGVHLQLRRSYAEAEALYRRALQMQETYYGGAHPTLAETQLVLAQVLSRTHRYEESERLCWNALDIAVTQLGEGHHTTQRIRADLAFVLSAQGRDAEAEGVLRRALAAVMPHYQGRGGEAMLLLLLGKVLTNQGRFGDASRALDQSLQLRTALYGADSFDAGEVLVDLGRLERLRGDHDAARGALALALAVYAPLLRPDHPLLAKALGEAGHVEVEAGAFAAAEPLLRQALAIQRRDPYTNPYQHNETLLLLGVALTHLGRYEEAEVLLRASLRMAGEAERADLAEPARQALRDLSAARSRPLR